MKNYYRHFAVVTLCSLLSLSAQSAEDPGAYRKAIAEAGKSDADRNRTNLMAPAEVEKTRSEAAKNWADGMKAISEAHLNHARREQLYLEMDRLRQRMRITEYEFHRITKADYQMNTEISFLEGQGNLVRSLILGRANWKTWLALEALMERVGDADVLVQVMFDIKVDDLSAAEFVSNDAGAVTDVFNGGNLGELYSFVQKRDYSFKKYGKAHKVIMKVVAMMSKAAEFKIRELRDINQAIRLTIAKIDGGAP
jgi:hypothetical protein